MPLIASEKVPLTPEEAQWLMTIYNLRVKDLFFSGAFRCLFNCLVILFPVYFIGALLHDIFLFHGKIWLNGELFSSGWTFKLSMVLSAAIISCSVVYFFRILPFKQDARSGVKQKVSFTVTSKEYYETTGQYFIRINWPLDKLYEITADAFNNCEEGGTITMSQAIKSGYIFCENDNAKIKMFVIKRPNRRLSYGW